MPMGNSQTMNMISTAISIRVVRSEFCPAADDEVAVAAVGGRCWCLLLLLPVPVPQFVCWLGLWYLN